MSIGVDVCGEVFRVGLGEEWAEGGCGTVVRGGFVVIIGYVDCSCLHHARETSEGGELLGGCGGGAVVMVEAMHKLIS
jgi:hypothetical protein